MPSAPRIVAVVPCYNEEAAIAKVVADLHATVPDIDVFVYDNCSTDNTAEAARRDEPSAEATPGRLRRSTPVSGLLADARYVLPLKWSDDTGLADLARYLAEVTPELVTAAVTVILQGEVTLQPGVYRGQCAEFCGFQHAKMAFLVIAERNAA